MLRFDSASVRIANSSRAIDECFETAFPSGVPGDAGIVMLNAAMGHKFDSLAQAVRRYAPDAAVLGTSCGGVVGREGAGEAMTHLAMMTVSGPASEYAFATVDDVHAANAYDRALALAQDLKQKLPQASVIYLLCPGKDINCTLVLKAFDEVFSSDVVIFGGTSADNYKAVTTIQHINGVTTEHGAWAVGFADATLKCAVKATHGFTAYGEPMTVTKSAGNLILELDNQPAWPLYMKRLSRIPESDPTFSVIASGALALELPDSAKDEYGSPYILRGAFTGAREGAMYMAVTVNEGDKFRLTARDEALIFSEQEKALGYLKEQLGGHTPVAVFQADCLARGRTLFNKVMKDELVGMMQDALSLGGEVPPWLGMYGFGEFCPLGGKNAFHTYTTSLLALYR